MFSLIVGLFAKGDTKGDRRQKKPEDSFYILLVFILLFLCSFKMFYRNVNYLLLILFGGATVLNDDGTYDIYINARLPVDKQWHAFLHELGHILDDHFFRPELEEDEKEKLADDYSLAN